MISNNADGPLQRGTREFYHNHTVSLSASHYFNTNWQLSLRSAYDKRHFSAQNYYTTFTSDTATEAVESFWNQMNLAFRKGKNKWITDAGYKKATDEYAFNSGSAANKNISTLFQSSSRYEHEFSAATSLIAGIQFQNKSISSNDRGNHTINQAAGFILFNQSVANKLFLSPALRVDYTQNSGTELVPQLNVAYKIKNLQLRASAGKTIRQPDFTELYNNYNKIVVTSGSIGNPNLVAERSFSYEAGADLFIRKEWKISTSVFRRNQSQLIDWVTTNYTLQPDAPAG
jgi:vitamin B12 transporter